MKTRIATMKSFGAPEVLEFQEAEIPKLGNEDFLLKGDYATVTTADVRIRSKKVPRGFKFLMGLVFGFQKPKFESLGTDYAGTVVQVGNSVKDLNVGDRVVVDLGIGLSGYRTYRVMRPKEVWAKIPDHVSSDTAVASVFGGITALVFLRDKLKVQSGERVLVIGAGGSVGSSAVQLAKYFGTEVSAVCSSGKFEIVRGLGASQIFDYNSPGWEDRAQDFDVVLDCVGTLNISSAQKFLKPKGRIGFVVADLLLNLNCVLVSAFSSKAFIAGTVTGNKKDLNFLLSLISQEKYKPLIGQRFPFLKVIDAHREVESGHRLGATLIEYAGE